MKLDPLIVLDILSSMRDDSLKNCPMSLKTTLQIILQTCNYEFFNTNTINTYRTMSYVDLTSITKQTLNVIIDDCIKLIVDNTTPPSLDMDDDQIIPELDFKRAAKAISSAVPKNDRMAWLRLNRELNKHLAELDEINPSWMELTSKRQHILDHVDELRDKMISECIHPEDQLTLREGKLHCAFCNRRVRVI